MKAVRETRNRYYKVLAEQGTSSYTHTIAETGEYLIELIGGGGGCARKSADDTTGSGAGASGGYFKGILSLESGDILDFAFGTGGTGVAATTYSEFTANPGTASTLTINNILTITTNGGNGGRTNGNSLTGITSINDSSKIVTIISTDGINGSFTRGGAYAFPSVERTMSPLTKTTTGYGSGGGFKYPGGDMVNGADGGMRITRMYLREPQDYDYSETIETRKLVLGTEKKFYKYIYRPFVQPILSSNGTIGGGHFATKASAEQTGYNRYAWKAFDNDVATMWAGDSSNAGWIEIYNPDPLNVTSIYWTFPASYTGHNPATLRVYAGDDENNLIILATIDTQAIYTGNSFTLDLSDNTNYYKIYRFETLGQVNTNTGLICGEMTITATAKILIETSRDDYDSYSDEGRTYYKAYDYTTPGTYTFNIEKSGLYLITLIGGGGGSAQTDGGTDNYADTGWANHYGHNGANGGIFQGYANLTSGTLTITVGAVGTNLAGKGNAAGNGGDSYAIYTPLSGDPIEIARAGGGHSGFPEGSNYSVDVPGGIVTYDFTFFEKIVKVETGKPGKLVWVVHI